MSIAIFWNEFPFQEINKIGVKKVLYYYLIEKNLSNEQFGNYFENVSLESIDVRLSPKGIIDINGKIANLKLWQSFDAILILAELDWHGNKLTNFYGLKIAQQLRLANIKCPIFICSFMPENYLIEKEQFKILNFRGHYFIQLPKGFNEDYEISLLDEMELLDCKMHFCGLSGIIKTIWHKKPEALSLPFEKGKSFIIGLLNEIRSIRNLPEVIIAETQKLENELTTLEKNSFSTFLDERTDRIFLSHLEENDKNVIFNYLGGWEVLILEDKPAQVKMLKERLEEISDKLKVHLVKSYSEAVKKIEEDIFNKITIAIVDFRLEDSLGNCKNRQGYSFISWLLKQNRFTDIFVYSGQSRTTVLSTFTKFGFKPNYKRKTEVTSNVIYDFLEEIIEKGNQMYSALLNQPSSGIWEHSLRKFYAYYRNHEKYKVFEQQISNDAKRYIRQINYFLELDTKDEKLGWFNSLLQGGIIIPPFKNIRRARLKKESVPPQPGDDEFFETFKKILVIRRIALWLRNQNGINNWTKIANLIFEGTFFSDKPSHKDFFTFSCISDGDYPSKILIEEKNWFNSIIHNYNDPESIYDKEKVVFLDGTLKNLFNLIMNNIDLIKSKPDLYGKIQSHFIITRITNKNKNKNKNIFKKILEILGDDSLEFLNYLLDNNNSLLSNNLIKKHIISNKGTFKKSILKDLPSIINMLENEKDHINYTTPLRIFLNKDRGDAVEKLAKHFHIEFELSILHPYEAIELITLLKKYPDLENNITVLSVEKEMSEHITLEHYHGKIH